ncbi:hypothetical protein DFA_03214 [Cavenderia fasciculata]|uniref:Uncharacterized protein n=1 Tax=Cavenderia fasciculata TaxID=261658 RepID=F4PGY5_CACFS|nr:uncharacterized protein DFA_03214 [Cavenderia fasciculata]EGG24969.1 hypothetical protein DFA_03214 [Cavenderia fasciculata]|eukprot:XP_004362820.1 hypothetical protein DFA_03214 [Cavenderia fasciculata]
MYDYDISSLTTFLIGSKPVSSTKKEEEHHHHHHPSPTNQPTQHTTTSIKIK